MLCCRPLYRVINMKTLLLRFLQKYIGQCRTLERFIDDTADCFGQYGNAST
jgi:hypothetical protein